MLRWLAVTVVGLVGCGGASYQVHLVNRTEHVIEAVYIYPTGSADHGPPRAKLAPNAEAQVKVRGGNVDVLGVMEKVRVDPTQSETRAATETIGLKGPVEVVFHEEGQHPSELSRGSAIGVSFRKTVEPPPPAEPPAEP